MITVDIEQQLYPYITAIVKHERAHLMAIGGMPDHVHMLISIPTTIEIARFLRVIKASSSKFINKKFSDRGVFAWQEGYGAFSVSVSMLETVNTYIRSQKEHHKKMPFDQEYITLLKKHGIVDFTHALG
jgi:putative transposase